MHVAIQSFRGSSMRVRLSTFMSSQTFPCVCLVVYSDIIKVFRRKNGYLFFRTMQLLVATCSGLSPF